MSSTAPPGKTGDLGNRSRLLQAATDAFAEQGYEAASLRSIAEAAGVSFQLIAYYFGSKEELWLATVNYLFERYMETGKGLGFTPSGNLHEQFHNHLRILLTDTLQRPQLRKIWIQEYLANSDRYRNVIRPQMKQLYDELALPYYREVVRLGIVTRYTPEEIGLLFGACVQLNLVSPHYVEMATGLPVGSPKSVERQVDLLFEMLTMKAEAESETQPAQPSASQLQSGSAPEGRVVQAWEAADGVPSDANRSRQLEIENRHLKQLVGSLSLEKKLLLEALAAKEKQGPKSLRRSRDD